MPYRIHAIAVPRAESHTARAGMSGVLSSRPDTLRATFARYGSKTGSARRAASSISEIAPPNQGPELVDRLSTEAPVARTMIKPETMFVRLTTTDDPVAAMGDTPRCCAMAAMAAICHTFPGTYLPRFETNQMCAASMGSRCSRQARSIDRQVPIRIAYAASTSSDEASRYPQPISMPLTAERTLPHCRAIERVAYHRMTATKASWTAKASRLRSARCNDGAIEVSVLASCGSWSEGSQCKCAPCSSEPCSAVLKSQQRIQSTRERDMIARGNQ